GLDICDVANRRGPADALHHDGAHHGHLAFGKAELLGGVPPLPGIAGPGDVALMRDPPGAVTVGELAAGAIARSVAVGDGVLLDLDQDAVHRGDHEPLALNDAGDVGDVVGPAQRIHGEPETAGNVLHRVARLHGVVGNVAPHRGVHAGGAHLHDEPALADHHVVDMGGSQ